MILDSTCKTSHRHPAQYLKEALQAGSSTVNYSIGGNAEEALAEGDAEGAAGAGRFEHFHAICQWDGLLKTLFGATSESLFFLYGTSKNNARNDCSSWSQRSTMLMILFSKAGGRTNLTYGANHVFTLIAWSGIQQ